MTEIENKEFVLLNGNRNHICFSHSYLEFVSDLGFV